MAEKTPPLSAERLLAILENTKDVIYSAGADGNITYISPQVAALGMPADQILGTSLLDHIHPDDVEKVLADFQETLRTGREFPTRFRVLTADGRVVHLEEYGKVTMEDGRVVQITGVIRDITDRAIAEQALRDSEERFRAIFDRSHDCIFVVDFEGRFLDANQAALTLLGYRADEIPQLTYQSLLDDEGLSRALGGLAELLRVGVQHTPAVYRLTRKDGTAVDVETLASIIYRGGAPYAVLGVARNVTAQRRIEAALRESEERLRLVLAGTRDIIYTADARGRITYVSPQIATLGYTPEEVVGTEMFAYIHPDDRPSVMALFLEALEREMGLVNCFRIVARDGRAIPFEESSKVTRRDGRGVGISGILRDITARREMEAALRESEARLRELVDRTGTGFVLIDEKGVVVDVNEPYARLIGAPGVAAVVGRSVIEWTAPDERARNAATVERCARDGFIKDFETVYQRPDGSRAHIVIDATVRQETRGKRIVSYCRDITGRKQAEAEREAIIAELQESLAKVKQLSGIIPICMHCKKVRDDQGYWKQVETFIRSHSEAEFSHGLCPDCIAKYYPED